MHWGRWGEFGRIQRLHGRKKRHPKALRKTIPVLPAETVKHGTCRCQDLGWEWTAWSSPTEATEKGSDLSVTIFPEDTAVSSPPQPGGPHEVVSLKTKTETKTQLRTCLKRILLTLQTPRQQPSPHFLPGAQSSQSESKPTGTGVAPPIGIHQQVGSAGFCWHEQTAEVSAWISGLHVGPMDTSLPFLLDARCFTSRSAPLGSPLLPLLPTRPAPTPYRSPSSSEARYHTGRERQQPPERAANAFLSGHSSPGTPSPTFLLLGVAHERVQCSGHSQPQGTLKDSQQQARASRASPDHACMKQLNQANVMECGTRRGRQGQARPYAQVPRTWGTHRAPQGGARKCKRTLGNVLTLKTCSSGLWLNPSQPGHVSLLAVCPVLMSLFMRMLVPRRPHQRPGMSQGEETQEFGSDKDSSTETHTKTRPGRPDPGPTLQPANHPLRGVSSRASEGPTRAVGSTTPDHSDQRPGHSLGGGICAHHHAVTAVVLKTPPQAGCKCQGCSPSGSWGRREPRSLPCRLPPASEKATI
ncbi:hypothetical protein Cadr_000007826 [Camelus dromedarius]|uniref:Uncharacterized protein n=1 Tax=Camelus dromedarius TaxID=9838 RepID=A0A5N4E0G2_CAMDR|nr:hypothetical protein Cadr_000007826 [Camelus dromedarius]